MLLMDTFRYMRAAFKPRPAPVGVASLGGRNYDSSTKELFKNKLNDAGRFFGQVEHSYQRQPHALQLVKKPDRDGWYKTVDEMMHNDFNGITPENYDLIFGRDEQL
jgi:hypothetical protein